MVYDPVWFTRHPQDIDVVTHELMHVVQGYGDHDVSGWLTEGIADYVRYGYGVDNPGPARTLPDLSSTQASSDGYRITARFLVWLEAQGHAELVWAIDARIRAGTYTEETWTALTGQSRHDLWAVNVASPGL
jgi:hypothetical protein